ncbi:MAG: hypothetical protein AAGC84_08755 [Pseudomonas sp.]
MTVADLRAREAYQLLKDIAMGERQLTRAGAQGWTDNDCGVVPLQVDGWQLSLFNEEGELGYCAACIAPDGRLGTQESWGRFGNDPVQLLSRWEREQLERLLRAL